MWLDVIKQVNQGMMKMCVLFVFKTGAYLSIYFFLSMFYTALCVSQKKCENWGRWSGKREGGKSEPLFQSARASHSFPLLTSFPDTSHSCGAYFFCLFAKSHRKFVTFKHFLYSGWIILRLRLRININHSFLRTSWYRVFLNPIFASQSVSSLSLIPQGFPQFVPKTVFIFSTSLTHHMSQVKLNKWFSFQERISTPKVLRVKNLEAQK